MDPVLWLVVKVGVYMYNVHVYGVLVLKLLEVINTLHVRNVFTMQIYNIFMYM